MDKRSFFLAAMKSEEYRRTAWIVSAFSLIQEDAEAWKKDPYPYRIVQRPDGMWYVDPQNLENLFKITDAKPNQVLYKPLDAIELDVGDVPTVKKKILTTYGNILVNYVCLIYPFGNKIDFLTGKISASQIEKMIVGKLRDTPKEGEKRDDGVYYVDEYLRFANGPFFLAGLTPLFVPAGTEKAMTVNPEIYKLRAKLLEENKERLHDPAVIAKIEAELVKADKEWIKGDPAENFLLSGKAYNVIRKKLFLQVGAEVGLEEKVDVVNIPTSLSEGWDIERFPEMNNSLRAGSFNRGAQTMLGGESVKWLLRASSNMNVAADDCGATLGFPLVVTEDQKHNWVGFSIVNDMGKTTKVTEDNFGSYLGKHVMKRSPMFCRTGKTDYCKTCVGDRLSLIPTALSSAVADYGNAFLALFLALAHGKALLLSHMDYKKSII